MVAAHQRLGVALVVVGLAGAAWAVAGALRGGVGPSMRAYSRLAGAAVLLEALLGGLLYLTGHRPAMSLHLVYGAAVALAIPLAVLAAVGADARREAWLIAAGMAGIVLLGVRAVTTGG